MGDTINFECECNSWCKTKIRLSIDEAEQLARGDFVVIANDCPHGPSEGDVLVEQRETYSLYREGPE